VLPEQGQCLGSQPGSGASERWHGAAGSSARVNHLGHTALPVGSGYTPAPVATANGAVATGAPRRGHRHPARGHARPVTRLAGSARSSPRLSAAPEGLTFSSQPETQGAPMNTRHASDADPGPARK
jgi:hypothetical protein